MSLTSAVSLAQAKIPKRRRPSSSSLLRTSWRKESRDSLSLASSSKDSETRTSLTALREVLARSVLAAQANSDEITWPGVSVCSHVL